MLCMNSYTRKYIGDCRAAIAAQLAAYQARVTASRKCAESGTQKLDAAIDGFEPQFLAAMVLTLDSYFVHRARAIEKKDGNPLNEVRMLCDSIMNHNGRMSADKTIKYDAAKAVLKYRIGDAISLNVADFTRLSAAFFAELERKYL